MTSVPRANPTVHILGTHGIPARYGGFETAAQNIALHLEARGWNVVVYGQAIGGKPIQTDVWRGIKRVLVGVKDRGWITTAIFDLKSIAHSSRERPDVVLTFGYNTGIFNFVQRVYRIPNVINMDGLEWTRARHGKLRQAILWVNEKAAALFGQALIGDHPEITVYLTHIASKSKLRTIAYGAHPIPPDSCAWPAKYAPEGRPYLILIARLIPENNILSLVRSYSERTRRADLLVLGKFEPDKNIYHRHIQEVASPQVRFVGGVYEPTEVESLRQNAIAYLHGHTVGGTNPSLVEAMAAGNAVIAHDNRFNRWVVGEGAIYFRNEQDISRAIELVLSSEPRRSELASNALARFASEFTWARIGDQYQDLLESVLSARNVRDRQNNKRRNV